MPLPQGMSWYSFLPQNFSTTPSTFLRSTMMSCYCSQARTGKHCFTSTATRCRFPADIRNHPRPFSTFLCDCLSRDASPFDTSVPSTHCLFIDPTATCPSCFAETTPSNSSRNPTPTGESRTVRWRRQVSFPPSVTIGDFRTAKEKKGTSQHQGHPATSCSSSTRGAIRISKAQYSAQTKDEFHFTYVLWKPRYS
jgi:hypothetical protein